MSVADQSAPASRVPRPLALTVRLSAQFVSRLCARIQKAASEGSESTGLLFGAQGEVLVMLQAFKSVAVPFGEQSPPLKTERLEQLILASQSDPEVSALDLIGWYRSRASGGLHASEIEFHNANFPHTNDLALILRPEANSNMVLEFYSRANGAPLSSEAHRWGAVRLSTESAAAGPVEIAMQSLVNPIVTRAELDEFERREPQDPNVQESRTGRRQDPAKIVRSGSRSIVPERRSEFAVQRINAGQVPGLPALRSQPKRRLPWLSSAIVCAVMAAATFAFLFVRGLSSESGLPTLLRAILPDTGLMLRAEGQGDRVLLSWNRRNAVVRSASSAILHIDDGSQHRDVHLDSGQVENGLVLYRPGSNDVTFRLEVLGQQGSRVAGNVRVLDGAQSAPLELSGNAEVNTPSGAKVAARAPERRRPEALATQKTGLAASGATERASVPEGNAQAKYSDSPVGISAATARGQQANVESPTTPPILVGLNGNTSNAKETDLAAGPGATETAGASANVPPDLRAGAPKNVSTATFEQTDSRSTIGSPGESPKIPTSAPTVRAPLGTPQKNQPLTGIIPARPIRQVLPDTTLVSPAVLASHPQVEIVVQVDTRGKVTGARVVGGKKMQQLLTGAALYAARQWTFTPATLGGHSIESEHTILFQFQPPEQ